MSSVSTLRVPDHDAAKGALIKLIARQMGTTEVKSFRLLARWTQRQGPNQDKVMVNALVKMLQSMRDLDGSDPSPIAPDEAEKEIA